MRLEASTPEEKKQMAEELKKHCPEALEMLMAVKKHFGLTRKVEIKIGRR